MKKLIAMVALLGACTHTTVSTTPGGATTGASDARGAVAGFFGAVKNQDLQAMSVFWGTKDGAARDNHVMTREQLEQRELIMLSCLRNERYQIVTEAPAPNGERVFAIQLTYQGKPRTTTAYTVEAKNQRWYLRSVDIEALREVCSAR